MNEELKVCINNQEGFVDRQEYVKAKTKQLQEFGYPSLTEKEVNEQIDKIKQGKKLTVIGMFIEKDLI